MLGEAGPGREPRPFPMLIKSQQPLLLALEPCSGCGSIAAECGWRWGRLRRAGFHPEAFEVSARVSQAWPACRMKGAAAQAQESLQSLIAVIKRLPMLKCSACKQYC